MLPAGVHWYHPQEHALVEIGPPPGHGAVTVVVTGVPWRTGWRYRERGYRHIYWDAGTMLSQLQAAAASAGLPARLHTRFPDAEVGALVGSDGVHEWPVAVVALDDQAPTLRAGGRPVLSPVDAAPVEFPLVTAAQHAGDGADSGPAWDTGDAVDLDGRTGDGDVAARPVETVVLARGSQRLMDPTRSLPGDVLRTAMAAALRGIDVPHWVAVHAVDGVGPGLYAWPDLGTPVRAGALRDGLHHACMDQALGRDAAFVVIAATAVTDLDDRGYREAQLAAGLVEGRLHLLAYALGATASGMTFVDGIVPPLLGRPVDALLFTCVGVGEYTSRAGGPPGAPTAVALITPR